MAAGAGLLQISEEDAVGAGTEVAPSHAQAHRGLLLRPLGSFKGLELPLDTREVSRTDTGAPEAVPLVRLYGTPLGGAGLRQPGSPPLLTPRGGVFG